MTVSEFRELKPKYKNIEGDELLDAMTDHVLRQQQACEIMKPIMPIWKTHTLRWLFYRRKPNIIMGNPKTAKWTSSKRCKSCKQGVNQRMGFMTFEKNGTNKFTSYCPHCQKEYIEEANTNFSYRAYKTKKTIENFFWKTLDRLHLIRNSTSGRYDMFGDEARYVKRWVYGEDWTPKKPIMKYRKWWEYILIEKPIHNF